jgi:hypothetical protein
MLGVGTVVSAGTASASISAVTGSAYGYYSLIGLFGGPPTACGSPSTTPCPDPAVTLPAAGSTTPVTGSLASEDLVYGPAHIFDSGPITISTQGAPGATSTVTSSTSVQGCTVLVSGGCNAGQIYAGPFTASSVSSSCSADGSTNPTGSVTINSGQLTEAPPGTTTAGTPITVPTNPTPNYTVSATFPDTGKVYTYVFNQQIVNPDGSLTVNAAHEYLNAGANGAQGDLIFGQVVCGAAPATGAPTITSVSPPSGTTAGGQSVTITGTNLSSPTAVDFGTVAGTVTSSSSNSLVVTTPSEAAGTVNVSVTNGVGTYTDNSAFTYATPYTGPYKGQLIISQLRLLGPYGSNDQFVDLYNTTGKPLPLTGWSLGYLTTSLTPATVALGTGTVPSNGHLLLAGSEYSLAPAADVTLPQASSTGGVTVLAPDGGTVDAVGFTNTAGYFTGTPLAQVPLAHATTNYSFVRTEVAGQPVNTSNNSADLVLIVPGGPTTISGAGVVGGPDPITPSAGAIAGAPDPADLASPAQSNAVAPSALLDTAVSASTSPNRSYTAPTLAVRRTITNNSGNIMTAMDILITPITTSGTPGNNAVLYAENSAASTQPTATGTASVQGLTLANPQPAPATSYPLTNVGLDAELSVPLPTGGLLPGNSISIELDFNVATTGHFLFGYDVLTTQQAVPVAAATPSGALATGARPSVQRAGSPG